MKMKSLIMYLINKKLIVFIAMSMSLIILYTLETTSLLNFLGIYNNSYFYENIYCLIGTFLSFFSSSFVLCVSLFIYDLQSSKEKNKKHIYLGISSGMIYFTSILFLLIISTLALDNITKVSKDSFESSMFELYNKTETDIYNEFKKDNFTEKEKEEAMSRIHKTFVKDKTTFLFFATNGNAKMYIEKNDEYIKLNPKDGIDDIVNDVNSSRLDITKEINIFKSQYIYMIINAIIAIFILMFVYSIKEINIFYNKKKIKQLELFDNK